MMRPHEPFLSISDEQRQKADDNFLFENLRQRLAQKPLYWDYVLQLAQPGDPVDDPSQPWPDDRKEGGRHAGSDAGRSTIHRRVPRR
jgi:catalase